jgi:hypothetical protein
MDQDYMDQDYFAIAHCVTWPPNTSVYKQLDELNTQVVMMN